MRPRPAKKKATSMRHAFAVQEIARINEGRKPKWLRLKYERMRRNVFAFYRGTDHLFALGWSEGLRPSDPGPRILICGDLHLENFGAYRSTDGVFLYDINDFDEAIVAPCGFDLTRCVASILLASNVWRLSPLQAERLALAFLDRYRDGLAEMEAPEIRRELRYKRGGGPVQQLLGRAAADTQAALLALQTKSDANGRLRIRRRGGLHPAVGAKREAQVREAVEEYGRRQGKPDAYRVLDVSRRIAGIGSLGVRRYLVLINGHGPPDGYQLVDLKQAAYPSIRPFLDATQPGTEPADAARIVNAQRQLQSRPPAGLDCLTINGRGFRMREMIPAENRTSLDQFQRNTVKLSRSVIVAGRITGWSHARGAWLDGPERVAKLIQWANSAGLESVLAAAVRQAARARRDYHAFCSAMDAHGLRLVGSSHANRPTRPK
jgi:uncharacterized protein (DUF2252 family)